jgi:hypothetical protein
MSTATKVRPLVDKLGTEMKRSTKKAAQAKVETPVTKSRIKEYVIGGLALATTIGVGVLIYSRTGKLDFEDFAKSRRSM